MKIKLFFYHKINNFKLRAFSKIGLHIHEEIQGNTRKYKALLSFRFNGAKCWFSAILKKSWSCVWSIELHPSSSYLTLSLGFNSGHFHNDLWELTKIDSLVANTLMLASRQWLVPEAINNFFDSVAEISKTLLSKKLQSRK